jgi:predicted transcriptional regulator
MIMTAITQELDIDDSTLEAVKALCKDTRMSPSEAIQQAIRAYRRQRANDKYLGAGLLDLAEDHPSETKRTIKKALQEKHGYTS